MSEKQRQEMEELRKTVRECQELIKCPGWEQLGKYAEGQIIGREIKLQGASEGLDGCLMNEFSKGEIAGIRLFLNIPAVIIKDFTEQLEDLSEEVNDG